MYKNSRNRRKPDFLMLLTIFVCLGVALTTTVNAAEPDSKGWGIQLTAESGCETAAIEWQACSRWQQDVSDFQSNESLAPQRAAIRLSSEALPDTGLVAYYTLSDSRQFEGVAAELRFINRDERFASGYDSQQFGMALKQQYGSFGLSVGFEADRVDNLTDDPLIYFGLSNRW